METLLQLAFFVGFIFLAYKMNLSWERKKAKIYSEEFTRNKSKRVNMKKLMMFLMVCLMLDVATAKSMFDGMSKEQLAEYDIVIVNKKTGKEVGRMSRAEYKVVKIGSGDSEQLKAQLAEEKKLSRSLHTAVVSLHKTVVKSQEPYNSVILHAGAGKDGLDRSYNNGVYEISEKDKAVGGVTGCRTYGDKGICASAFTNSLFTLGLKLDFK